MAKYIDVEKIKWNYLPLAALGNQLIAYAYDINKMEAEDVKPVVRAKWKDNGVYYKCSNCGKPDTYGDTLYCSHCGAKMDFEREE